MTLGVAGMARVEIVALVLLGLFALPMQGQVVTLAAKKGAELHVDVPPTGWEHEDEGIAHHFWEILVQDLKQAGPFTVLPSNASAISQVTPELQVQSRIRRGLLRRFTVEIDVVDSRTRRSIYKKIYTGSPEWIRRMAHRTADDFTERLTGVRGVADSRVVIAMETSGGVKEIFQVDRDGEGLLQLTRHGSLTISPTLAEDGRLAYVTYKSGPPELWGQRTPGGAHVRLYPTGTHHPGAISAPAWSPDGKQLAFVKGDRHGHSDLMVLDLASQRVRQLTFEAGINTEPAWNPGGSTLAFTSDRSGSPQIYLMEVAGSVPRQLTTEGTYNASPDWNPDGSSIAYVSRFEGRFNVFVYQIGEGKAYQLTQGAGSSESPTWSPDGRWLSFTNSGSGIVRLMVSDLAGKTVQFLGFIARAQAPDWSRSR